MVELQKYLITYEWTESTTHTKNELSRLLQGGKDEIMQKMIL